MRSVQDGTNSQLSIHWLVPTEIVALALVSKSNHTTYQSKTATT
jgi:hypothetical protein